MARRANINQQNCSLFSRGINSCCRAVELNSKRESVQEIVDDNLLTVSAAGDHMKLNAQRMLRCR